MCRADHPSSPGCRRREIKSRPLRAHHGRWQRDAVLARVRSLRYACVRLFVTLSIARALEPCHGPGTVMRIPSRCVRRLCVLSAHGG
eukprot:6783525-Prymnesium_polylepis.1